MADFTLPGGESPQSIDFGEFGSLNTKANRPAIQDDEFAWNENWIPIGPGNLRTLWAEGSTLYTTGKTILYTYPYNFGANNYIAVFFTDGTAVQVTNPGGVSTTISSTANLFYNAGVSTDPPQCVQWANQYLIIVGTNTANTAGGYFIWDGTHLFQAGTLAPDVTISNGGENYTSAPTVSAFGGSGTGATFTATVDTNAGVVTKVTVTNPGSGYKATDVVQLAFTGGGSDTSAQAGPATVAATSGVTGVTITNGGTGYTTSTTLTISGGGGTGAQAVITGLNNGTITQISIVNVGSGYTSNPTIAASAGGSGLTAVVNIGGGQIGSIAVGAGGSGYTSPPQVIIDPPNSDTLPVLQATAHATISAGAVSGIVVDNPGIGYVAGTTINVKLLGGNNAASGEVNIMPFGQYGNAVETYQGTVWVANGNKYAFTAPGSASDFNPTLGGGVGQALDNFLKRKIVALKQSNGFLYLFGDSSVNAVSNMQTTQSGTIATTTVNNSNIDPQIGCAWRDTVVPFGRALMFANPSGIYALYGGAAQKVSQALDTLFAEANFSTTTPTAAVCLIYGIPVYVFNFNTLDPYQNTQRTVMMAWDGQKWFVASQIKTPTFLSTQEINSQLTAWLTDGTNLYPAFQTASTGLTKSFQTKLTSKPSHIIVKSVESIYVIAEANSGVNNFINLSVDNEKSVGTLVNVALSGTLTFIGSGGVAISFVGSGAITFTSVGLVTPSYSPMSKGLSIFGRFLGFTGTTTSQDVTLILLSALTSEYSPVAP